jgi:transcriptional regulator with XRE-family HTH domain
MSDLYNRIMSLCEKKGVSGYRMCKDIKIQPSILTDLKMGRQSGLSAKNADKMAAYFGVSVGFLLGTETKKAPTQEGERKIGFDDFTYAFYEESKDLPDEKKKMLLDMARFMKADIDKGKG